MNVNILQNCIHLLEINIKTSKEKIVISSEVKTYIEFGSTMVLKQLIKVPMRITSNTTTLINHILTSSSEKLVQAGIIETSLSDHQLLFCTREKVKREKPNKPNCLIIKSITRILIIFTEKDGKLFP